MLQIKTGLKGTKDLDICNSIIGQLSDGLWENSPRMNKYWKNCDFVLNNDEVVLNVSNQYIFYNKNGLMSDVEILQWFAKRLKQVCKSEEADNNLWKANVHWKRDCMEESKYISSYHGDKSPTIADCYKAYDVLMGRYKGGNK